MPGLMVSPRIAMVPLVGRMRPSRALSVVVFPAPFGPRRPTIWPWRTVKDKSSTATTPAPNRLDRPVTSMTTGESIAAAYGVRAVPLAATAARFLL